MSAMIIAKFAPLLWGFEVALYSATEGRFWQTLAAPTVVVVLIVVVGE